MSGQHACVEGALELPRWLAPNPPATFAWNISGDSMRGAGIFDRDLAVVDRSLKAGHGSVVVAAINGEMSIKRLLVDGNVARLSFDNPDLPAFAVEELTFHPTLIEVCSRKEAGLDA
ncbi:LexA repressor [Methylobacterium oxalidis]|nr:LexA repressor [Methylobacterium oxalidis]